MAQRRVEDPALAVGERHQHRLIVARPVVRRIGVGGRKHRHIPSRTAKRRIQLVALVYPRAWKTICDRVARIAHRHLERQATTVAAGGTRRPVGDERAIFEVPHGPGLLGPAAPSADADHLVERLPPGKCVVGAVHRDQPAPVSDVFLEGSLQRRGPSLVRCVVVEDHDLILVELRPESAEIGAGRRRRHDVYLKESRLLELFSEHGRRRLPFVVRSRALAVKDHDADRRSRADG